MKWSYLGQSFEVCMFMTFFRLHRQQTTATTAAVHDIHPSEGWASVVKDDEEVFTFAAHTDARIMVVAPTAVGTTFRRRLEASTATRT